MPSNSSSITTGAPSSDRVMTRAEVLRFFERRQVAYDNLDAAALAADYADDCQVDSPTGGPHTGRANVQKVLTAVFDAFRDMKTHTDSLVIDGNNVAQIVSVEGTDLGGFLGLSEGGKAFHLTAVFLYEFRGPQILKERRIYDFTGLLTQIGVLKIRPV
jgi:steroid delta-isomerase-like uncharacterized protein